MRKVKRTLAVALSSVMALSMAACSNSGSASSSEDKSKPESTKAESTQADPTKGNETDTPSTPADTEPAEKDPVNLVWWYRGNGEQKDTKLVQEQLNEQLKTYPGLEHVTVTLNCYTASEYKQAVSLAQSSNQQIDILNTVNLNFAEEVEKGSFMALDELIDSIDGLKDTLPEWLWDMASIDGEIYMVPNYQRASNMVYLITPTEWLEKYGDAKALEEVMQDSGSSVEDIAAVIEEYANAVRAGEGETHYVPPMGSLYYTGFGVTNHYDVVSGDFVLPNSSDKVMNKYLSDEMVKAYEISAKWYDAGLIHPEILTINSKDFEGANMLNDVSYIFCMNNQVGSAERVSKIYSDMYGYDVTAIPTKSEYYINYSWAAGGNGVAASCEHPEEAMLLIDAMTTEKGKELYNTVVYGIEGTHYNQLDETHIETIEYAGTQGGVETSYAAMKWIMGNTFNAYLNQACTDDENELSLRLNEDENNIKSPLIGFSAKTDAIKTQIEQTTAVTTEYSKPLMYGVMSESGWKSFYDDYADKMNTAGVTEIIEELQKQVDAFK